MLIRFPTPTLAPDGVNGGGSPGGSSGSGAPSGDGGSGGPASSPTAPSSPGGGSSPSSAPSGAPSQAQPYVEPTSAPAGESFQDFESLFAGGPEFARPDPGQVQTPVPPAPPVQPQQPEVPPVLTPGQTPGMQQAPPQQPQGAPQGPQTQVGSVPELEGNPLAIAQGLRDHEAAATEWLAGAHFQLSPQELELLNEDMSKAVPMLLAKSFVKSQLNVLHHIGTLVPRMVQRQVEVMRRNMANENKFYKAWPQIDSSKHGDLVKRVAQVYRANNPQAPLEQAIAEIGPMVMMAAKIASQPAAPQHRSNGTQPFVPAHGGVVTQAPVGEVAQGEFDYMNQHDT